MTITTKPETFGFAIVDERVFDADSPASPRFFGNEPSDRMLTIGGGYPSADAAEAAAGQWLIDAWRNGRRFRNAEVVIEIDNNFGTVSYPADTAEAKVKARNARKAAAEVSAADKDDRLAELDGFASASGCERLSDLIWQKVGGLNGYEVPENRAAASRSALAHIRRCGWCSPEWADRDKPGGDNPADYGTGYTDAYQGRDADKDGGRYRDGYRDGTAAREAAIADGRYGMASRALGKDDNGTDDNPDDDGTDGGGTSASVPVSAEQDDRPETFGFTLTDRKDDLVALMRDIADKAEAAVVAEADLPIVPEWQAEVDADIAAAEEQAAAEQDDDGMTLYRVFGEGHPVEFVRAASADDAIRQVKDGGADADILFSVADDDQDAARFYSSRTRDEREALEAEGIFSNADYAERRNTAEVFPGLGFYPDYAASR